jgi:hypothetical protein
MDSDKFATARVSWGESKRYCNTLKKDGDKTNHTAEELRLDRAAEEFWGVIGIDPNPESIWDICITEAGMQYTDRVGVLPEDFLISRLYN